ncbi:MAG TPA: FIST N-terminal domain-containing protein [Anaerolineales bacterium]|nr:FIST N-terminal domain-containing protein [Anaerolineales bacterium]HNE05258.1 FIST N-terminal domain-containing protein [Anaerolineales bacterium]HNF93772.1 FIST N-terminal domain-containing protein [Anaerolineales bacterium]HNO92604.1 FIST N-terminal domain-containing protein [Anaerolineales bacterium]
MAIVSSVGTAQALDGREAGLQATHQALNKLGANVPGLAVVIASHQYQAREVLNGVSSLLGDTPMIGFSSPAGLTRDGLHPHSVVVALLSGDFQAETLWLPGYAQSGRETAQKIEQHASARVERQSVLFFADGFNGDAEQFCNSLPQALDVTGALSSGDLHTGNTYQLMGAQTGAGCMTTAFLRGNLHIGVGSDHGWDPVGNQFRVTRSRGFWLRTLDGRPASEAYAGLFGQPARDWAFPPLSYLARLYPLGMEQSDGMVVRAPIRVEADGSFRMNAVIRDGVDAFLLVGSRASCERAAKTAAQHALLKLGDAKPRLALVLVDVAWQMLLKAQPGAEIAAVQEILGDNVPVAGGYTLGQVVTGDNETKPKFLNQHIIVIVFGEPKEQ